MNEIISYIKNLNLSIDFLEKLLLSAIIFALFYIGSSIFSRIIVKIFNRKDKGKSKKKLCEHPLYTPVRYFFICLGIYLAIINLGVPQDIFDIVSKLFRVSIIWFIALAIANMITPNSQIFAKINKNVKDKATTLLYKIIRGLIYLVAIVIIIAELGYDINGLIAGLGVGGLAISLAAQDTLKNLIAGIVMIFDKPFIVGDWIETPSIEGIVEDITFRSTRIRTFKDSIITVPNSTISNDMLTNWSKMEKRRINFELIATFDTPLKNICNAINKIKEMLENQPNVHKEPIYVNFSDISDNGQNILIYFYIDRTDYSSYLAIKENVNYKIMQILKQEKVELAYNTQTIYIAK